MPESMFMRVVLPLPFSPSRDRISPLCSSKLMSLLATTLPKRLVMCSILMAFLTGSKAVILSLREGGGAAPSSGICEKDSRYFIVAHEGKLVNQIPQKNF